MDNESSCKETKMLFETLVEEILSVALRETEFKYQIETDQF